ncbi:hypothetical protein llap_19459 [Limosa lapponica baueri]|uniref:Potassium channel tetramerisation-type BTB domain-containing protein n=1 Tax=Limosa lapponica baueri TaxID=1758121 RepID=A0A2I0T8W3_LIMLA|nr:hypothetical protein llap_19459 [Limosa lapponica baueri]
MNRTVPPLFVVVKLERCFKLVKACPCGGILCEKIVVAASRYRAGGLSLLVIRPPCCPVPTQEGRCGDEVSHRNLPYGVSLLSDAEVNLHIATAAYPADLLTRARGMVVVTGQNKVSGDPDDAMSSSDAEDDFQEPATPTATQAGQALPLLPQQFPEVVPLNVGGMYFTTRLSTLRRYEDTMLAAMFSGRHYIPTDAEGRYFIDRDGTYFG